MFEGQTFSVEIKSTPKPMNSKLIYPLHKGKKNKQPDVFLLVCQIDEDKHCIKGFTTSKKILVHIFNIYFLFFDLSLFTSNIP